MKFRIIASVGKNGFPVCDDVFLDFPSVQACAEYVLKNSFKFSNWSILRENITSIVNVATQQYAAFVDLGLNCISYCHWD